MKSIKFKYICFVLLIAIAGCREDESTEGPIINEPTGDFTIEVVSGVTGLVTDENSNPITNAAVTIYNRNVKTDENGIFYVNNVGLKRENSTIHIEKEGYFDGFKSFIPSIGEKVFCFTSVSGAITACQDSIINRRISLPLLGSLTV